MKTEYRVKYQLASSPVGRIHRKLSAALRDRAACLRSCKRGGDCQGVGLVVYEDGVEQRALTHAECESLA